MYYEIHGSGEPVVLLHGAFMAISDDWSDWINELSKTRKVIAVEMQGHGRTADIKRDLTYENLADDVAGLLDYLKIPSADVIGYSLGGGVAMQCAIRHPEKVRKVVSISAPIRRDGWVKEGVDALLQPHGGSLQRLTDGGRVQETEPDPERIPGIRQARRSDGFETVRLRRRQSQGDQSSDVLHPRRRRRCAARSHRGNVPPQGRRPSRRHAAAPGIETGHFAQHNTRYADEPHDNDRPDGERLSRCEAPEAIERSGLVISTGDAERYSLVYLEMEFNPSNNVIKLCVQGMDMEGKGNAEEASRLFLQAWNEATNDFEKYIAAYFVARHQDNVPTN